MLLAILLASFLRQYLRRASVGLTLTRIDIRERLAASINHHPPGIFSTVHGDGKRRIGRDYMKVANRKKGKDPVATLQRP